MNEVELIQKLQQLQNLQAENEIVEFKEAKTNYDFGKLGQYFSALCNEANLTKASCAWLVFGIENNNHKIVGTKFRENPTDLDSLKKEIADKTTNRITFIEIYELHTQSGRVLLFKIPPAPKGLPVAFNGHYYGRDGESLQPLNLEEIERIRFQSNLVDFTAQIITGATINHLDPNAIKKAKLTINGKITRTALILLGREEAEHFIGSFVKIRWILKTLNNQILGSHVYGIPLILNVDSVYNNIRNLNYIYTIEGTLFPEEMPRYDPFTIREPLNNAIAHQDYTLQGYINVVEFENDHLVFSNLGSFLPKSVEEVVLADTPYENYRNPFLVAAMKNLNMIETEGGGILKIFNYQRQRLFPMPDYDLSNNKCKVTITGKILNLDFARILIKNPSLKLEDILLLDKIQKNEKNITDNQITYLKKKRFVEGRKPNVYLSFNVIEPVADDTLNAEYIANKSFDDNHFKKMILEYITKFGITKRKTIDNLIIPKLSAILNDDQKKQKVGNYLSALRKQNLIKTTGFGQWVLVNKI